MTDSGASVERSRVHFGLTEIDYKIRRSHRRTTVSIAIDPKDGVVVTAPPQVTQQRLDRVVLDRGHWIARGLRRQSSHPPVASSKEFVGGEGFSYLGKQYRLRVETGPVGPLQLRGRFLCLEVPIGLPEVSLARVMRAALVDWYRARARKYLPARSRVWAKKLDVEPSQFEIFEPTTRWGSSSKDGSIRINWRIIQCPTSIIDYVLAHEFVHLVHRDHSRAYWALLGRVMPDYEARKGRLKEMGPGLIW